MKVLVIHNRYRLRGGEDAVVDDEVALLREHGHDVLTHIASNDDLLGRPALASAVSALWSRRARAAIAAECRRFRPDVAHVHNTFARLSASVHWALGDERVPRVQTLHNFRLLCANALLMRDGRPCEDCVGHLPWRGVVHRCYHGSVADSALVASHIGLHAALRTYADKVNRFIALSEHARGLFVRGGLPADRIDVKPNFSHDPGPPPARREGLLYVGRLSDEKGVRVLAEAARQSGCRVQVVGDGPLLESCRRHPQLQCVGSLAPGAVLEVMRRSIALLVPSLCYESMPRVVVEAYASGLPVIGSAAGALGEMIEHERTGLLVPAGDVAAWSTAMARPDRDPQWPRMGMAARERYERVHTPERCHAALVSIYEAAIQSEGTPPCR